MTVVVMPRLAGLAHSDKRVGKQVLCGGGVVVAKMTGRAINATHNTVHNPSQAVGNGNLLKVHCLLASKWLNCAAQLFILLHPLEVPFLTELMLLFNDGFKAKMGNLFPTRCQAGQSTIGDHAGIGDRARKSVGGTFNDQAGDKVDRIEVNPDSAFSIFKRIILFQR